MNAMTSLTVPQVRSTMEKLAPEFAKALPPGVSPERFRRVCLTAIQQNPKLLDCTQDSLWGACMKAAQDGLMPDGREGAMVPRWNGKLGCSEAHWMPMVAGLIAKAKRKGNVASLSAQIVYEGEVFDVLMGDEDRIVHRRDVSKVRRGSEIAVYAIATMKDGAKEREVMSWEQVQQVAAVSADRKTGDVTNVWKAWPEEMARKSCIRRLSKRLPSLDEGDDELRQAVERVDELYDFGKQSIAATPAAPALGHDTIIDTSDYYADLPDAIPSLDAPLPGGLVEHAQQQPAKPAPSVVDQFRTRIAGLPDMAAVTAFLDEGTKARATFDAQPEPDRVAISVMLSDRMADLRGHVAPPADDNGLGDLP